MNPFHEPCCTWAGDLGGHLARRRRLPVHFQAPDPGSGAQGRQTPPHIPGLNSAGRGVAGTRAPPIAAPDSLPMPSVWHRPNYVC